MGKVGKISPIKREYAQSAKNTIAGSLAHNGLTRIPGTTYKFVIHKEPNGAYKTGLNPDADYILKMSPEEAEQERERIGEWLKFLNERVPHLDLSPRGEYYTKMMDYFGKRDAWEKAVQPYDMKDDTNIFNLEDPFQLITYAWLRVDHRVAPSYQSWRLGKCSPKCSFFVDDEEFQSKVEYKHKTAINKAISLMSAMTAYDQRKVARLLGLPATPNTTDEQVYNLLDEYIKSSTPKNGIKLANINNFMKVAEYKQENLNIRFFIKQALDFNIYRKKGERIYEGENEIGATEEEVVLFMSNPKNSEELSLLQDKIRQANSKELV